MTYCDLTDLPKDQCACCITAPVDKVLGLARTLMRAHGLVGWTVEWDSAKKRFGRCSHNRKVISLSREWAEERSLELTTATILHEIAHALVGPGHGHGPVWQAKALELGIDLGECGATGGAKIAYAAVGKCANGHMRKAHRLPTTPKACGKCSPVFSMATVFTWTFHGKPATMSASYNRSLMASQAASWKARA